MKKITAIIGSPKPQEKSITYTLTQGFIETLKKCNGNIEIESEIIHLSQKNIMPCNGCLSCKQTGKCVIDDDMETIHKSMNEADLLIFGSPVHFTHISSVFMNFVERSMIPLHTFEYLGKPFINIVTTNGSGEQEADKYLSKIAYLYGCIKIGFIFKSANDPFKLKTYNNLISKTTSILSGDKIRPAFINRIYFSFMKKLIKDNKDYFKSIMEIWSNRNWLDKSYSAILNVKKNRRWTN